ncbi:MAG: M56 family metallopeptidase, partial [Verrucomicrobiales bacterium]
MIEATMELLVWWTLRATLLLGVVGLVVMALRSRAASLRHALWVSAIAGSLALPVLACILPSWGILPNSEPPAPAGDMRALEVPQVTVLVPVEEVASRGSEFMPSDVERPPGEDLAPLMAWDRALVIGWALGAGILLVRLLIGQCSTALLVRFRSRAYFPGVRITGREIPPMVCGLLAPKIILPAAALAWSDDRLEAVLRHERAHICRGDLWWGWGARLLCAAQWFNPLVWIAAARMRSESEHAC